MYQITVARAKAFYRKYERTISPVAFAAGFVWDNITLQRIDLLYENLTFAWNLVLALAVIAVINAYEVGYLRNRFTNRYVTFLPILLQFSFGGLFSAFIVFYVRSGSLWVSWPFLLFLTLLFVGNDFFRKRYLRLTFQLSIFFIALFTYSVFVLPVLVGKMGTGVFLASGVLALLVTALILLAFMRFMPGRLERNKKALLLSIGGMYLAFQLMYFANIIPPIPLSLKESGMYHSIELTSEEGYLYEVQFEPAPWYFFKEASDTLHVEPGAKVYHYNAVFAPTRINTTISHRWLYFSEQKGEWVEISLLPFPIAGGRGGGYRGYSFISNAAPGKWRVDVVTGRGQVLGRRMFTVIAADQPPQLETGFR